VLLPHPSGVLPKTIFPSPITLLTFFTACIAVYKFIVLWCKTTVGASKLAPYTPPGFETKLSIALREISILVGQRGRAVGHAGNRLGCIQQE